MQDHYVIRFGGTLDIGRLDEFKVAFDVTPPNARVLVDLTRVEAVDSVFLAELLLFRRRHAAKVAVVIPRAGHVARIFSIANIGTKVNVHNELDAALRDLSDWEAPLV